MTRYDAENDKGDADLYLVATAGGKPQRLTSTKGNESEPAWSPDGRWIAFVAKRGEDKEPQLYVIGANGGEAIRVERRADRRLRAQVVPGLAAHRVHHRGLARHHGLGEDQGEAEGARRLEDDGDGLGPAAGHALGPLHRRPRPARLLDPARGRHADARSRWRSGHSLAAARIRQPTPTTSRRTARRSPSSPTPTQSGIDENIDVYVVAASGGAARNLTADNPAADESPRYSPDGRYLAYAKQAIKGFYGDTQQLMLLDRKSGAQSSPRRGLGPLGERHRLGAGLEELLRLDRRRRHGARVPLRRRQGHAARGDRGLELFRSSRSTASRRRSSRCASRSPSRRRWSPSSTKDGAATKLSDHNDAQLAATAFGKVESVTYKGAGGADIQMWVNYPPGFDPAKKYPLYLLLHGGPHNGIHDSWTFRWNAQVFASWGYVTAWHNFHGSSGFGQAFTDSINPDGITKPYEDTIKAAEWFAAQPWIDAERMAAGGGSYGGFLASVLLGREHPFKTLVAHAAVYNHYTMYGGDYGAEKNRFFEAWERPEEWAKYSPSTRAPPTSRRRRS